MTRTAKYASAIMLLATCSCSQPEVRFAGRTIDETVSAMTLEQKIDMVVGQARGMDNPPYPAPGMPVRHSDGLTTNIGKGKVKGAAAYSVAIDSLGIPSITYADGSAGVRIDPHREGTDSTFYCTAFPTGSALAASWDTELVSEVAGAIGEEARDYGVDILLAPGMNIIRNPLCGRNFEYYSEDPVLAGKIAAAYVNGVQSKGVGASPKHFAVNNQETLRNGIDVEASDEALRGIYLKGFEIMVKESSPWTIMSSYNKINGTLASENKWLLTDVLRGEWRYNGTVLTDWWAEENGARQQAAGNDILLPGTEHQHDEILAGLKDGSLTEEALDRNVRNVLGLVAKTLTFKGHKHNDAPDLEGHAAVARRAGSQGMVLLKNENGTLPLAKGLRIALFGNCGYDTYIGGTGSGNVNRRYKINIAEGLEAAGFSIDSSLSNTYRKYISSEKERLGGENFWWMPKVEEMDLDPTKSGYAIGKSDAVVVVLGRMAGEGTDRQLEKGDYYLSDKETENLSMICRTARRLGKKIILLLNMGGMVELPDNVLECFDAVLHTWLPGQEAGHCVADVLSGDVNPSGRLPFTWARAYNDYPSSGDFPLSDGSDRKVIYKEGTSIGYRYFNAKGIKPLFPFGYGLSYTSFEYKELGDGIVEVTNTGNTEGSTVVMEFENGILASFGKTGLIGPGKTEKINTKQK